MRILPLTSIQPLGWIQWPLIQSTRWSGWHKYQSIDCELQSLELVVRYKLRSLFRLKHCWPDSEKIQNKMINNAASASIATRHVFSSVSQRDKSRFACLFFPMQKKLTMLLIRPLSLARFPLLEIIALLNYSWSEILHAKTIYLLDQKPMPQIRSRISLRCALKQSLKFWR